jgi:methionyl-tRNA formyltransferase
MSWAVSHIDNSVSKPQKNEVSTYYRKRTPADSKLDPERSIKEQFNILRVSDPDRYPAFFIMNGQKYTIRLEKSDE